MGIPCVTPEMVREAQVRLKGIAQKTGLSYSNSVSHVAGCQVYLKMENLQRTGSFKLRGAYNKVAALTDEERAKGVIAASAGNHAQGVALAATSYGCKSIVCMPKHAPLMKIAVTFLMKRRRKLKNYQINSAIHMYILLTILMLWPVRGRLLWKCWNNFPTRMLLSFL